MFAVSFWSNSYNAASYWSKFGADVDVPPCRTVTIQSEVRASFTPTENRSVIIMANCTSPSNFDDPMDVYDIKPYLYDWSPWLTEEDDTISSFLVSMRDQPNAAAEGFEFFDSELVDIKDDSGNVTFTDGGILVWFKVKDANQGDVTFRSPGRVYKILCEITTDGGIENNVNPSLTVVRK